MTPRAVGQDPGPAPQLHRRYNVPILMYHRIVPISEAGGSEPPLVVPPETFAAQMKGLFEAGWHSITMATLASDMEMNRTIPPRTFVITFDDGWGDGYQHAFPIMREYGFVGTFYVIGGRIGAPQFLSARELRLLEAAGNDIGNHTADHIPLPLFTEEGVRIEMETGSEQIAGAVGHRPATLAYPMGKLSPQIADVASRVPDIKMAVTTEKGMPQTWFNRYHTSRVRVGPATTGADILFQLRDEGVHWGD